MQGFNMGRYYAPEGNEHVKPKTNGRKTKGPSKQLTVRFEVPFSIWCEQCEPAELISQGVRFNAEKKRVGFYYTTPIWSFRFRHILCGGWIEIRTDPRNTQYIVHSGAKRKDEGQWKVHMERVERYGDMLTNEERERRRNDAFAALEGKKFSETQALGELEQVERIYKARERDWVDTYTVNQRARKYFRLERKVREVDVKAKLDLQNRLGWSGEIVNLTEEDNQIIEKIQFEKHESPLSNLRGPREIASSGIGSSSTRDLRILTQSLQDSGIRYHQRVLRKDIHVSTDPFLKAKLFTGTSKMMTPIIPDVKFPRDDGQLGPSLRSRSNCPNHQQMSHGDGTSRQSISSVKPGTASQSVPGLLGLVNYGSDDD